MGDVTELIARARYAIQTGTPLTNGHTPDGMLINWPEFWGIDHNLADWLIEPVIPSGRSVAIYAPGGTGKSLFALWLAVQAAIGTPALTGPQAAIDVLYLDFEMTNADLAERLEDMGYGPATDLTHLHYALLPSIDPLDSPEGGKAVVELARSVNAALVIIDTFSRAVKGKENDADTIRDWYRWTGLHLKTEGRAFVRIDHAGKDLDKGQRGSSAKNDDVDVVWQMTKADNSILTLKAKKRRMGWVPDETKIVLEHDPIRYSLADGPVWPAGTADTARALDELNVPVDASTRVAGTALKAAGNGTRRAVVVAAVKYRKEDQMRLCRPQSGSGTTLSTATQNQGTGPTQNPCKTTTGTGRNQDPTQMGTRGTLLRESPVPSVTYPQPPDYTQRALTDEEPF